MQAMEIQATETGAKVLSSVERENDGLGANVSIVA
jgi:hypothetical protein